MDSRRWRLGLCVLAGVWLHGLASSHAQGRASAWPALEQEFAASTDYEGARDRAVIVAVERYQNLSKVEGAVANGRAWRRFLTSALNIPHRHIIELFDSEAQDYKIRDVVSESAKKVKPGGRLWFVFIGHGAPSRHDAEGSREKDGLLVGFDAGDDAEGLEKRSVRRSDLMLTLGSRSAENVSGVAILDACFSGKSSAGDLVEGLMPMVVVSKYAPRSVVVMTAARGNEFAGPLPGTKRPAFSYLVLGGLRGWADANRDGRVTAREVVDYAEETLNNELRGSRLQHPTLEGASEDTVLTHGKEPAPEAAPAELPDQQLMASTDLQRSYRWPGESTPRAQPARETRDEAPSSGSGRKFLAGTAVVLTLGGAATALVGGVMWGMSYESTAKLDAMCPARTQCPASLEEEYLSARDKARVGNYLVPIGAGVAVLGLTLWWIKAATGSPSLSTLSLDAGPGMAVLRYGRPL